MGRGGDRGQGTFGGGEGKTRVRSRGDGHTTREEKNRPQKSSDLVFVVRGGSLRATRAVGDIFRGPHLELLDDVLLDRLVPRFRF